MAAPSGILGAVSDVTQILQAVDGGDPQAVAELLPLVYDELKRVASAQLSREKANVTLDATALVHEAYLRLIGSAASSTPAGASFANRRHFFAAASEAMRRILVDRARARLAAKRGGNGVRLTLELDQISGRYSDDEMIDTDSVIDRLAQEDSDAAVLVRMHVFGGFSIEEAGASLGMTRATAYRNWNYARAWLLDAITSQKRASR